MSKHQAFISAIDAYQPGGSDAPLLYSSMELSSKAIKALKGEKIKVMTSQVWTSIIIVVVIVSVAAAIATVLAGTPALALGFIAVFIVIIIMVRDTVIAINDDSIDFYMVDTWFGSNYSVYEKFSIPFDKIAIVMVQSGRSSTRLMFMFSVDDEVYKIKVSVPNEMKDTTEQSENLELLLETLRKEQFLSDGSSSSR